MNVLHFVKICEVLTILHQLICRDVANFGTRCISTLPVFKARQVCQSRSFTSQIPNCNNNSKAKLNPSF